MNHQGHACQVGGFLRVEWGAPLALYTQLLREPCRTGKRQVGWHRREDDELLFGKGGRLDAVARVGDHCLRVPGRVRCLPASSGDETHEKGRRCGDALVVGEDGRGTAVLSVDEICCVYGGDYFQMRRHYHLDWPPEAQTLQLS